MVVVVGASAPAPALTLTWCCWWDTHARAQKLQVSLAASPYDGDQTSGGGSGGILTSPNQLLRVVDVARRASTSSSNVNKSWQMEADGHANCVCSLARSIASTEARRVERCMHAHAANSANAKAHAHKTHGNCLLRVARDSRAARGGENRDGLLRVRRWWRGWGVRGCPTNLFHSSHG